MKQKYQIGKTDKDFIRFIKEKNGEEKDEKWLFGNLFQFNEGDFEKTDLFEMKYWTFKTTDNPDHELKVQRNATEYTFIITGEIIGKVEAEKVNLKAGDYIIIKPGTVNNLVEKVIKDVIGITIKTPSSQNDTVKIKKEFMRTELIEPTKNIG